VDTIAPTWYNIHRGAKCGNLFVGTVVLILRHYARMPSGVLIVKLSKGEKHGEYMHRNISTMLAHNVVAGNSINATYAVPARINAGQISKLVKEILTGKVENLGNLTAMCMFWVKERVENTVINLNILLSGREPMADYQMVG